MNALSAHVEDYLRLRRALGFKLERAGQLLPQLVAYLEAAGAATITSELAIGWARLPQRAQPKHWAQRLAIARGFARYVQTIDPATEVPPPGVFPSRRHRPAPYLWSARGICRLLQGARALRPPLRAATHETLFGLFAASGLRLGEAIGLQRDDVDLVAGVITIRQAKFDRSRLVPLHPTTTEALRRYAAERDRLCPRPRSGAFFLSSVGTTLTRSGVDKTFREITIAIGVRTATARPRVHDLRHNSAATRNNRLAALHSLFGYLALQHPEHAATVQRVLAIPPKRTQRNLVTYLTEPEVDALLDACDQTTWTGRRDHAMIALTIQTGLRISELAALSREDITLTAGANVHTVGKGRKERRTPLVPTTKAVLKAWITERPGAPGDPLFPTTTGKRLSRDAIERRLAHRVALASTSCPSLKAKHVTMHTLRHTAAMRLLLAGNDVTVIALWPGHEQVSTTNVYLHADMTHKQQAIDRTKPLAAKPGRYRPPDPLLAFLEAL
jgi:integrase